jgi:hypothetical protein
MAQAFGSSQFGLRFSGRTARPRALRRWRGCRRCLRPCGGPARRDLVARDVLHQLLVAFTASGPAVTSALGDLVHLGVQLAAGTTSCTRPMRCASAAVKRSAVRNQRCAAPRAHGADHVGADGGGDQAQPGFAQAEVRRVDRHRDVAGRHQAGAAGIGVALHRAMVGLGQRRSPRACAPGRRHPRGSARACSRPCASSSSGRRRRRRPGRCRPAPRSAPPAACPVPGTRP